MANTDTWNAAFEAVPSDTDAISGGAETIRDLKVAVKERMAKDHYMNIAGTDADHGEHNQVTLRKQSAKPTNVADKGFVYTKIITAGAVATVELFYMDEEGQEVQFTNCGVMNVPSCAGSDIDTGTSIVKWVTPKSLTDSTVFGIKTFILDVVGTYMEVDSTTSIYYFNAPSAVNGYDLVRAQARITGTAGTTGATTVQVRNMTKYSGNDALTGAISIASGAVLGTVGTVNTSYDDVATDDLIKVYVTAQSTTKPKGLQVILEYKF